jgi:hypothetical protein
MRVNIAWILLLRGHRSRGQQARRTSAGIGPARSAVGRSGRREAAGDTRLPSVHLPLRALIIEAQGSDAILPELSLFTDTSNVLRPPVQRLLIHEVFRQIVRACFLFNGEQFL